MFIWFSVYTLCIHVQFGINLTIITIIEIGSYKILFGKRGNMLLNLEDI